MDLDKDDKIKVKLIKKVIVYYVINQFFIRTASSFRAELVEQERDYVHLRSRFSDLESKWQQREKEMSRIEGKNRSMERKMEELNKQLKDLEKENQLLNLQVFLKNFLGWLDDFLLFFCFYYYFCFY